MIGIRTKPRRPRRPPRMAALAAGAWAAGLALLGGGAGAAATPGAGEPTPHTDASIPALRVTMIGATPLEAGAPGSNETWGVGELDREAALVRYTTQTGWSLGPRLEDATGQPLSRFELDPSPLAGQMTPHGSGVLVGTTHAGVQAVLVRGPGEPFTETEPVPTADLEAGETLFATNRAPLIAPLDEGASAGALVVPFRHGGVERWVLSWSDQTKEWTREPIEIPPSSSGEFRVLGIGASSPSNAWLIARLATPTDAVALFRRHLGTGGEPASWQVVAAEGGTPGEPLTLDGSSTEQLTIPGAEGAATEAIQAQVLTVTEQGVWIDGERADTQSPTTMFYKLEGKPAITSWCDIEGAPAGTRECDEPLPEGLLPTGTSRSIAWANPGAATPYGERVITGLPEGVSLRLEGSHFAQVLALGGSEETADDPGAGFGAAFSNPDEGWLGQESLPVHLTREAASVQSRLAPWPVPFRHALLAIAPQPGAPIGAPSSEALAVGDRGEVARYKPGLGWLPESLLSSGGRVATPRLRAVAWPTPTRAYAVGDLGQMWLWRGETGLWEADPATPVNFRGNLLGIAFDPNNPARGYAVGESGVLLRYGKTWTQEPASSLPAPAQGASFTSIAFAGSEAIVAYRKLLNPVNSSSYIGGLLVNNGTGWQIDAGAAAAMGSGIPGAVAGLPDGGAAFDATSGGLEGSLVFERQAAGAPWQPTLLPGGGLPGSLALFREGGALRAITAGAEPNGFTVESVLPAPPGFPPDLIQPYPIEANPEKGILRQTASGWSDEEHELNNVREPPGGYKFYDTVYQPDPISAVLTNPTGSEGWAVGGFIDTSQAGSLDTADVDRYPSDGLQAPGVGHAAVSTTPGDAVFAVGGGAACAAPCANRVEAGIGPEVWLSAALSHAGEIEGVRAFFYTGPGVANRREVTVGPPPPFPYARELARYAGVLASSPRIPAYPAATPTDLDEAETESSFEAAFNPLLPPLSEKPCSAGAARCQLAYALQSAGAGGGVRVIVLDDTTVVSATQLGWLEGELAEAKADTEPAIVVGNADLNAQIAARGEAGEHAEELREVLVDGRTHVRAYDDGASAYFYDAAEENVRLALEVEGRSVATFGSGTLGYVNSVNESNGAFLGASGFLLAEVEVRARNATTNVAPVEAKLIPNVGELALEAKDGPLLRRSQSALFEGLARRPRAGNRAESATTLFETDPYIPIPSICVGATCANGLLPEYSFSSSNPEVGEFVEPNTASPDPHAVLLGADGQPIPDSKSGLFCAYNAGTTIVTISAGGLSSSLPVTVQAGSRRQPCGVHPPSPPSSQHQAVPVPPPAPAPSPAPAAAGPAPTPLPPVPPSPAPAAVVPAARVTPPAVPFFLPPAPVAPLLAAVPPPVPTPARPTPPSGTSAVTTPVEAPEKQEEKEEAPESVSNKALAYHPTEHEPSPAYILGIVLLAALAGASVRGRPRRGRGELHVAPATISAMRAQRREERRGRGGR